MRLCGGGYRCRFCVGTGDYKLFCEIRKIQYYRCIAFVYYFFGVCVCGFIGVCRKNIETYSDYLKQFFLDINIRKNCRNYNFTFCNIHSMRYDGVCRGNVFILFGIKKIFGAIIFNAVCGMIFFMNNKKLWG